MNHKYAEYGKQMCSHGFLPALLLLYAEIKPMQMSGLDDRDLVFVRYVGQAKDRSCLPYFIAVDRSTESVGKHEAMLTKGNQHLKGRWRLIEIRICLIPVQWKSSFYIHKPSNSSHCSEFGI